MRVIHKNEGTKIPYAIAGNKICFDDDLTINLAKREEDWDVHIDICFGEDNELVIGAAAGRRYVAEIDIPKRSYAEVEAVEEEKTEAPEEPKTTAQPVPFDIDNATLTLWAIE